MPGPRAGSRRWRSRRPAVTSSRSQPASLASSPASPSCSSTSRFMKYATYFGMAFLCEALRG
uniref:Uncharacterized protein n=1 Tax=Arundo donax TaxID=35708 RepID=A0A0A9DM79_ARUDO